MMVGVRGTWWTTATLEQYFTWRVEATACAEGGDGVGSGL